MNHSAPLRLLTAILLVLLSYYAWWTHADRQAQAEFQAENKIESDAAAKDMQLTATTTWDTDPTGKRTLILNLHLHNLGKTTYITGDLDTYCGFQFSASDSTGHPLRPTALGLEMLGGGPRAINYPIFTKITYKPGTSHDYHFPLALYFQIPTPGTYTFSAQKPIALSTGSALIHSNPTTLTIP